MPEEKQAREEAGSSIADIVGASMSELVEENPDFFDETANWAEEDDPSLEFGDSDDEGEDDSSQEDDVPVEETASGGVGIDKVLQELDRTNPEYAKVIRGLQSEYTKSRQSADEVEQLRSEMKNIVDEWQKLKEETAEDGEDDLGEQEPIEDSDLSQEAVELFENMDETHKELFTYMLNQLGTKWAQDNGFVKMSDIEQREAQKTASETRAQQLREAVNAGIEEYGDLFGKKNDDGKFVLNPDVREKVEATWKSLGGASYKGTMLDLFKIACADEIIEYKLSRGPSQESTDTNILSKRMRANRVANGSSNARSTPTFYNGEKSGNGRRKQSVYDVAKKASRHTMSNI